MGMENTMYARRDIRNIPPMLSSVLSISDVNSFSEIIEVNTESRTGCLIFSGVVSSFVASIRSCSIVELNAVK